MKHRMAEVARTWLVAICLGAGGAATGAEPTGVLTGRVLADDGEFLSSVRILVYRSSPGDSPSRAAKPMETKTDRDGRYRMELPATSNAYVSVRALLPGYRSTDYRKRMGGDVGVTILPGQTCGCSFVLRPGAYVAGRVVDQRDRPIAGVTVAAEADEGPYGAHDQTVTDDQGRFELFELPPAPAGIAAKLSLHRAGYLERTVDDVFRRKPAERAALRIVLSSGRSVAGRLVDPAGKPVAGTMVESLFDTPPRRQATRSDADGRFTLTGLPDQKVTVRAHDLMSRSKGSVSLKLVSDRDDLELLLRPVPLGKPPQSYRFLGLEVADISPELQSYYDLPTREGVVVLRRDKSGVPFAADVGEGAYFNHGGHDDAANLEQLLAGMLDEIRIGDPTPDGKRNCQVFYQVRSVGDGGWGGDRIFLEPAQVDELKRLAAEVRGKKMSETKNSDEAKE